MKAQKKTKKASPLFLAIVTLALVGSAQAQLYTPPSANTPPGAGASSGQQEAYCNSVCSALVNPSGQVLGLTGNVGWTVADDLWCANHGSQTNPLVGASPVPGAAAAPSGSCPVTMQPGDTSCNQAVQMAAHCGWHNGQLEQQCEAYEAAGGASGGEKIVLALDIAATGICAGACAMTTVTGGTAEAACSDAGMAASASELIQTLTQKSSMAAKAVSAVMSGYGLYKGVKPILDDPSKAKQTLLGQSGGKPDKMSIHKAACQSALLFAIMTGMRYNDVNSQGNTKQSACNQVAQLASTAPTIGSNGIPIQANAGGSTGVTSGGGTGVSSAPSSPINCISSSGNVGACTGMSSNAPDVGALTSSGLGQQLAPQAAPILAGPFPSGGAGNAAGMAAGGAGAPSDLSGALSTVAAAAQAQSHALFSKVGAMAGNGGGGGGGSSADGAPNPMAMFASLFGQKGQRDPASTSVSAYSGAPQNQDIWHRNSPDNLFQIVSNRIQKESARLFR